MNDLQLLMEARRRGYQLVPAPPDPNHEFRPGDVIDHEPPKWAKGVLKGAERQSGKPFSKLFDLNPRRGIVLAVASRADLLVRWADRRVGFVSAKGLLGEPADGLVKISSGGPAGDDPILAALRTCHAALSRIAGPVGATDHALDECRRARDTAEAVLTSLDPSGDARSPAKAAP